jgi:hypothetical protein
MNICHEPAEWFHSSDGDVASYVSGLFVETHMLYGISRGHCVELSFLGMPSHENQGVIMLLFDVYVNVMQLAVTLWRVWIHER